MARRHSYGEHQERLIELSISVVWWSVPGSLDDVHDAANSSERQQRVRIEIGS